MAEKNIDAAPAEWSNCPMCGGALWPDVTSGDASRRKCRRCDRVYAHPEDAIQSAGLRLAIEAYGTACEGLGRQDHLDIQHPRRVAGFKAHDKARRELDAMIDVHHEDAPGGPIEKKDPHWPYIHSVDGGSHRKCGGHLRYRILNSDYDDRKYRCDLCGKKWVEEGADA